MIENGEMDRWPNMEYRGPMFYTLAHSSMSRWQRKAVSLVLTTDPLKANKVQWSEQKGFLWSSLHDHGFKRQLQATNYMEEPGDHSTARELFKLFLDLEGNKVFEVIDKPDGDSMNTGDFYVKVIGKDYGTASAEGEMSDASQEDIDEL